MSLTIVGLGVAAGVFVGILTLFEVGRRVGQARRARDPETVSHGAGPTETAILGLLGLLFAFTFSGAASRFEDRRHLIGEEANAIGTAYLRVDVLPDDVQPALRELFRRYLEMRIVTYSDVGDLKGTAVKLAEGADLQAEIWKTAVAACRRPEVPTYAAMLMVPALNAMIDITTTRTVATQNHPPGIIFVLLGGFALLAALMVGHATSDGKRRSWFYILIFAATLSLTLYLILDLEFPRLGLIRIDKADHTLIELRETMK